MSNIDSKVSIFTLLQDDPTAQKLVTRKGLLVFNPRTTKTEHLLIIKELIEAELNNRSKY